MIGRKRDYESTKQYLLSNYEKDQIKCENLDKAYEWNIILLDQLNDMDLVAQDGKYDEQDIDDWNVQLTELIRYGILDGISSNSVPFLIDLKNITCFIKRNNFNNNIELQYNVYGRTLRRNNTYEVNIKATPYDAEIKTKNINLNITTNKTMPMNEDFDIE